MKTQTIPRKHKRVVDPIIIPKIVVGGTLESILYAICSDFCLLTTQFLEPLQFEFFEEHTNLQRFKLSNKLTKFTNLKDENLNKVFGMRKLELYNKLLFLLTISGKLIKCSRIQMVMERNRKLRLTFQKGVQKDVLCENLKIFEPYMIVNLRNSDKTPDEKKLIEVHDHYKLQKSVKSNVYVDLSNMYDFPSFLYLYNDNLVAISTLEEFELKKIEYDFSSLRMLIEDIINTHEEFNRENLRGVKIKTHIRRQSKKKSIIERNDWKFYQFLNLSCSEILELSEDLMNPDMKIFFKDLFGEK